MVGEVLLGYLIFISIHFGRTADHMDCQKNANEKIAMLPTACGRPSVPTLIDVAGPINIAPCGVNA